MPASVISPSAATIASLGSAPVLKADEREQLELVREHFSDPTFALPEHGKAGQPLTALLPGERYWLSKECFLRYLQSSKGDARQAIPRIQATLLWRREIGVDEIAANEVESEGVCGKAYLLGYSTQAEPLFYITPSRRDTDPSERQFRHLVWLWERSCDLMGPGVDGAVVLLNFAGKSKRPSVSLSTRVLSMMTHHYPQRVAAAYVRNTPLMLNAFLTVVWPFIDPATKDKVDMKGQVGGRIDSAVLIGDWGGELDFTYDHATYQPYLLQLAGAKRQAAISRWQAAGAELGASEYDVRRWDDGVGVPTRSAASSFDDNAVDAKHVVGDASELDVPILV